MFRTKAPSTVRELEVFSRPIAFTNGVSHGVSFNAGLAFKPKEELMIGNPEYFICLRYNICSSFPIRQMIDFFKNLEKDAMEGAQGLGMRGNMPLVCVLGAPGKTGEI